MKRFALVGLLAAFAVVGALAAAGSMARTTQPFTLASPAFTDGGLLPQSSAFTRYGCRGDNIAPTLNWQGVPAGTASFALAMNDYDAPLAGGWKHWIVYNPVGCADLEWHVAVCAGHQQLRVHRVRWTMSPSYRADPPLCLYALRLTIPQVAGQALTYDQLIQAISGHVAGATVIIGTFVRQ